MATSQILYQPATSPVDQLVFANHAGDFSPTAANDLRDATAGNRTTVELALVGVASAAARQSARADLTNLRAPLFHFMAALEFAATPVAGQTVDFYWAPLTNTTTTNGPGGVNGATDAAYTGTAGSTIAESVAQLDWIGTFVCTDDATATIQVASIGIYLPPTQYGQLVVFVNSTGGLFGTDDIEMHVVANPIIPQGQAT